MLCGAGLHEMTKDNVYVTHNLRGGKKRSYKRCRECRRIADRKSRQNNQATRAAYAEKYRESHRTALATQSKDLRKEYKEQAYTKLGNKCASTDCAWINGDGTVGCTDVRCLQIDHVNNDGASSGDHGSGNRLYLKVINDTEGRYQLLCANCNWIKRYL